VGAVRVGDTVRRPVRPWTAAVHVLLRHLESVGFEGAPRVLGLDDQGREMLTYLEGETVGENFPWPAWARSDAALVQVGAWLKRLHDATEGFVPPPGLSWFAGQSWRPGLVIGHHDVAPFNAVWRENSLVGFVDWDTAGPSSREFDLAYAALSWVPLHAQWENTTALGERSPRLHSLLDAYGYDTDRAGFGTLVAARARVNADAIHRLAAGGDPMYVALLPVAGQFARAAADVESLPASFWDRPG
jgi:hypothetical protein